MSLQIATFDDRPRTQARGRARRKLLVHKAKELLDTMPMEAVSMAEIARAAGIPKGSAYHFFPTVNEVFQGVADMFGEEFVAAMNQPFEIGDDDDWFEIFNQGADRAVAIYNGSPSYRQLIIGGKAPPDIKLSDRQNDEVIGQLLIDAIEHYFELPEIPRRTEVFFYSVEICDLFLMLSMLRNDRITEEMLQDGKRAARAYLHDYVPRTLPRRAVSPN